MSRKRALHTSYILLIISCLTTGLCGCHKNCVCIGYDGGEYSYTADEVDARDVTCANMVYQAGQQYYSVCNWE